MSSRRAGLIRSAIGRNVGFTSDGNMKTTNNDAATCPVSEFRADAAALLKKVQRAKCALVLTERGQPAAVVLDASEYQRLVNELELLRDFHAASRLLEGAEGVPHRSARDLALAKLEE